MELKHEIAAIDISSVMTLPDVISGVADKKIVYVGEVQKLKEMEL